MSSTIKTRETVVKKRQMAAPITLGTTNFYISGPQRNTLSINVPGIMCVLIKMNACPGSGAIQPLIYQLSGEERSVQYGILNISDHPGVVQIAERSNLPIKATPIVVMFVNHIAYTRFPSAKKKTLPALKDFIRKTLRDVHGVAQQTGFQQSSFVQPPPAHSPYAQGGGHPPPHPMRGGPSHPPHGGRGGGPPQPQGGRQPQFQSQLQAVDDDDDHSLKMPDSVTPHNTPWEAGIKLMQEY